MWLKKTEVVIRNLIICMSGSKTCFDDVWFIVPKYLYHGKTTLSVRYYLS